MVDQTTIFEETPAAQPTSEPAKSDVKPSMFSIPDTVKDLIGDGKKYSDIAKALESIPHAQSHIDTIQQENREMRERLRALEEQMNKAKTAEEIINEMKAQQGQTGNPSPSLDKDAVINLVRAVNAEERTQEQKRNNLKSVQSSLDSKFGEKRDQIIAAKANEMGVDLGFMKSLAETSPKAFLSFFSVGSQEQIPSKTHSGIKMESITNVNQSNVPPKPTKSVLFGATTDELVSEWRRAGQLVQEDSNM